MTQASSLKELLLIRHQNRHQINAVNGNLGSALGLKRSTDPNNPDNGKPAIIVFVPQKIDPKWVPRDQAIPRRMTGPNGLECPVDVVEGRKLQDYPLIVARPNNQFDIIPSTRLRELPTLTAQQLNLRDRLRGWSDRITPGSQLAGEDINEGSWFGTLGCFARERDTGQLGFITNQHVATKVGQILHFASVWARRLGIVDRTYELVDDDIRFDGLIDETNSQYRVDCAFATLDPGIEDDDIDPRVPAIDADGSIRLLRMGNPVSFDINSMAPIGQRVMGVGRTMSFQRGTIVGFGYEFADDHNRSIYTDYLIVGDDPQQFSAPGDSGKLIFTDEETPRPIALLWGGWRQKLSNQRELQDWTYAIDINYVSNLLNVDLIR